MARTAIDTADQLIAIYETRKKRYQLSHEDVKRIAGKSRLRDAFIGSVGVCLRDDGYILINLREESNSVAVVKLAVIEKIEIFEDIDEYEYDDVDGEEEEFEDEEDLDDTDEDEDVSFSVGDSVTTAEFGEDFVGLIASISPNANGIKSVLIVFEDGDESKCGFDDLTLVGLDDDDDEDDEDDMEEVEIKKGTPVSFKQERKRVKGVITFIAASGESCSVKPNGGGAVVKGVDTATLSVEFSK